MKKVYIVGAGPAGLLMGKKLAEASVDVTILEAKTEEEHAVQHHWSDAIEIDMLKDVGLPVPRIVGDHYEGDCVKGPENPDGMYERHRITNLAVFSPAYTNGVTIDADFRHILADREKMCQFQKEQTLQSGCKIRFGCQVTGLTGNLEGPLDKIAVTGVKVKSRSGVCETLKADLVVDATGQSASVRTMIEQPAVGKPFNQNEYGYVYRTVRKFDPEYNGETAFPFVDHYRLRSHRGYSWVHFHDDDIVDIGGGARDPVLPCKAKEIVMDTIKAFPQVTDTVFNGGEGKNLKCMPPDSMVANGFLVIGHAAAQINPTQGCGICASYSGALLAAQVVLAAKDFTISALWEYNHSWFTDRGGHLAALYAKMKLMAPLTESDLEWLIEKDIMNGLALTHDYQGIYSGLTVDEKRRMRDAYSEKPELVDLWNQIYARSGAIYRHYMAYPPVFDDKSLDAWREQKEKLYQFA